MTIALESMAVAMPEVAGHPNRVGFRGVLTVVDVASLRAPSGSRGRKVVLTRGAAEAALPSLLGMALDYAPSFDRHDVRRKVGVITQAEIIGHHLEIGGYLYAKDFPEIVEEIEKSGSGQGTNTNSNSRRGLPRSASYSSPAMEAAAGAEWLRGVVEARDWKASLSMAIEKILRMSTAEEQASGQCALEMQARNSDAERATLGMSYEVTDVELADPRAKVWTLTKVTFTGAAILRRDKAAYPDTWIALG